MKHKILFLLLIILFSNQAFAVVDSSGILSAIPDMIVVEANSWREIMQAAALRLFWLLATISLVFIGTRLVLQRCGV